MSFPSFPTPFPAADAYQPKIWKCGEDRDRVKNRDKDKDRNRDRNKIEIEVFQNKFKYLRKNRI